MSLKPREYQARAIAATRQRFDAGDQRTLVTCPTGGGKTVIAAHLVDHYLIQGRVMALVPRDELVRQAIDKFRSVTGVSPAIEKAEEWSDESNIYGKPQIVVSTFQTQNSGDETNRRMNRFNPMEFSFLWVDEAHHATAVSYKRVIDYYANGNPNLKILGVTATADRADGEGLGQVFQSVAFNYDLPHIIEDGYLVPIKQFAVPIDGLDFSKVRTTAGDLNAGDLNLAMMAEEPLHGIVHATIEVACGLEVGSLRPVAQEADRLSQLSNSPVDLPGAIAKAIEGRRRLKSLIFTVSVDHAHRMAEILNRWIPRSAAAVDGEMPPDDRRRLFSDFRSGKFQFLANCMVAAEGFDEPSIELVVMARPTKSRALYAQQAGRGTRPLAELASILGDMPDAAARKQAIADSAKPHLTILDFVGNSGRHRLVSAADVLGADRFEQRVVDRAREIIEDGDTDEVEEALAKAQEEIESDDLVADAEAEAWAKKLDRDEEEAQEREEQQRRAGLVGTTRYALRQVDAFGRDSRPDISSSIKGGGATEPQIRYLVYLGVDRKTAIGYSKKQAGAVISSLKEKRDRQRESGGVYQMGGAA